MSRVNVRSTRKGKYVEVLRQYEKEGRAAVAYGVNTIRNFAIEGITSGNKSGATYTRRGVQHRASAAGEYPASDTGNLVSNIYIELDADGLGGQVESRAQYSSYLEFGTSKMAERPFMFPSAERARPLIRQRFRRMKAR